MVKDLKPIGHELDMIANRIVDAAFKTHFNLGPGLLESVYEECLCYELSKRKLKYQRQVSFPIFYDQKKLSSELRLDLLVEDRVILELKAVDSMHPIYEAQLLTYLKLTDRRLGFLINFNVLRIKDSIKRMVL